VALVLLPLTCLSFVASAACETIRSDIVAANALAVSLHGRTLSPEAEQGSAQEPRPPNVDELKNLQQFAATMRDIALRARTLSSFDWIDGFGIGRHPRAPGQPATAGATSFDEQLQLPVPVKDASGTARRLVTVYQRVRANAQNIQEDVSTSFGALAICVLPMLYALLGGCAYLARRYEGQLKARQFTGAESPWVRIIIAIIGGLVVGLFAKFSGGDGLVLPPLAIAFMVGYGADAFFVFLDGILQMVWRQKNSARAPQTEGEIAGSPVTAKSDPQTT
jgi:hypothetical protein